MGFLDSIFGNSGSGTIKKGMGYTDQGVAQSANMYRMMQKAFQDAEASGRYNPTDAMNKTRDYLSHTYNVNSDNLAAKQGAVGYRPGDSNTVQGQRHLSEQSRLEGEQAMLRLQQMFNQAHDAGRQSVYMAGQNHANSLSGAGNQLMNFGAQQQAQDNAFMNQIFSAIPSFKNIF